MSELVRYELDRGVAVVTIDNPPVNALSPGVPEGIQTAIERAAADAEARAVVVIGGGRTFIAGADIREFGKIVSGEKPRLALYRFLEGIEDCPKPVVMAIHGTALGGGLEVAMAGHYRVAVATAQVGQPEVKLGIIPGAAGTQRLPRLCGVTKAAELCSSGDPISALEAHQAGIIDALIAGDLRSGAIDFALDAATRPISKVRDRHDKLAQESLLALRTRVSKKFRGQTAPLAAIDAVEAAASLTFAEGCAFEASLFNDCLFSSQSKALIHIFFGERTVAKIPGLAKDAPITPIAQAAIVGAGTMGSGIATCYLNAGIPVALQEAGQEALDAGVARIRRNLASAVEKGRITAADAEKRLALLSPTLTYEGFATADIIIEAVFENLELKMQTFAHLDTIAKPGAILATNTSTLNIDAIAASTRRPSQVIGHHFFSPAHVMRLLEIVRGRETSDSVIATSMDLAKRLKKVGVLAGNCRGFIGNRMFHEYMSQAVFLVEEGAEPSFVDDELSKWGMAMGPLAVGDLAGIDVGWRIRQEFKHLEQPGVRYAKAGDRLAELGRYGQKTGKGWYLYGPDRKPVPDPEVTAIVETVAREQGITRRAISSDEVLERTLLSLVNEGAKILAEGIALRAVDIDIIYVNGYGFPAWRGGPMKWAELEGLAAICDRIRALGWQPAPLLLSLAEGSGKFDA
ncbi:MAG: enoyl-CoA hydratase/isomerase family protein [Bryobacterales bacterium]|nr:enoyl-CoA hydratase/isomerase family protein [Bryobacterales bacterium]